MMKYLITSNIKYINYEKFINLDKEIYNNNNIIINNINKVYKKITKNV